jgi:hypothetical protein
MFSAASSADPVRTVDLGRTAAQAEVLRIRSLINRQITRAVLAGIAAVFLTAVLVMVHVVAFIALGPVLPPLWDAVAILAFDLAVALLFGLIAAKSTPGPIEAEAKVIRDQALSEMKESLAIAAILSPLGRVAVRAAGRKNLYGMTLAALTARFLSKRK